MRKEKLSYLILLIEIIAIVWLHSAKSTDTKDFTPTQIVKYKDAQLREHKHQLYIQTANQ